MAPLRRLRVPTPEIALMMTIALRFIPTLLANSTTWSRRSGRGERTSPCATLGGWPRPCFPWPSRCSSQLPARRRPGSGHDQPLLPRGEGRTRYRELAVRRLDGSRRRSGWPSGSPWCGPGWDVAAGWGGGARRRPGSICSTTAPGSTGGPCSRGSRRSRGAWRRPCVTLLRHRRRLTVAGRTDAGVHARRQVVSLNLPAGLDLERLRRFAGRADPSRTCRCGPLVAGSGLRRPAGRRRASYRYFLSLGRSGARSATLRWHVRYPLDWEAMEAAAALVVGPHDLTAFTPTETEHLVFRRTVDRVPVAPCGGSWPGSR